MKSIDVVEAAQRRMVTLRVRVWIEITTMNSGLFGGIGSPSV